MGENVKERILEFIKFKNITMKHFESQCDLSTGYVTSMRKGFGSKKLNNVLNAFPELNREWLLYGEGNMLKDPENSNNAPEKGNSYSEDDVPEPFISYLVPMAAMGGSLIGFDGEGVSKEQCEKVISPIAGIDWVVPVCGDSMEPEYPNGSRVYVRKINPYDFIPWGSVFVLDTTNGLIIKMVVESDKEGYVKCVSLNPSGRYAPFDVPMNAIRAMYRVIVCLSIK